ncbi:hypothetical protein E8E12_003005 [Didymella heteroderae]|uniref:Uncharacterized protein n=1 Tax=Didymella heteroderae TaxID=1769908 RepID=A0A9P4WKZ0_9PLEO|nr:hypothetical protein E8E12_003005 [Didymella heteroderae]
MNAFAATQAEDRTITKPQDWSIYMVTAAVKCLSDEQLPTTFASHDEARYRILKCLNFFEAHNEYEWPDFTSFRYDFSQAMRLRRALVQDVFNALEKAGTLSIRGPGTTDSNEGRRQAPQSDGAGRTRITNRKRPCKREVEIDVDAVPETSDAARDAFLLEAMTDLVSRSKVDVAGYAQDKGWRDARKLADVVHDSLVAVWTKPQRESGNLAEVLRQKAEVWERHLAPRRIPLERASTPRRSPGAPQGSPNTVQKPLEGSMPAPRAASSLELWAQTFTQC